MSVAFRALRICVTCILVVSIGALALVLAAPGAADLGSLVDNAPPGGPMLSRLVADVASCLIIALAVATVVSSCLTVWVAMSRRSRSLAIWLARRTSPAIVRKAVLVTCGLALAPGAGAAVAVSHNPHGQHGQHGQHGSASPNLVGLQLPDLPLTGTHHGDRPGRWRAKPTARSVVVSPGDCLWSIAEDLLPRRASDRQIMRTVGELTAVNAEVIGANPNLIYPGDILDYPKDRQ